MSHKHNILFYILGILAGILFSHLYRVHHKKEIDKTDEIQEKSNSWQGQVDEREEKIINYVQRYGKINTKKCKEVIGTSEATANRALANMFHRTILNRAGAGRGVYYFLKNINN